MSDESGGRGAAARELFSGGGEMGARMREMDWARTPLGPVERWPQSLRTAAGICLNSRFPMVLWWGPELILIYNDAWRPVLGETKHPRALGSPGRDIWPEIWDVIGPMFEQVMAAGEATWSEDGLLLVNRYGFTEEAYFTWSYSPIRDEADKVGGVFTAVTETTKRVLGERRLRTLRDLGTRATQAKSAEEACAVAARTLEDNPHDIPFALIYLLDEEGRRASLAGSARLDAGTPAGRETVELKDGATSDTWPFNLVAETGASRVVRLAGEGFADLPGGAWPEAPREAVVLPLVRPGQEPLAGFLVAGLSPRLQFDEDYRDFMGMVAGQVATAVAEARAYEEERRRAEALAELDRAKTTFFSNVSHEFRTPLTLMLSPVEEILSKPETEVPPRNRELLEVAHRNGRRLLKLVNTLLDFSRIEAGRVEAVYEPTDLAAYTAELASTFRSAVERAGLRLKVNCPPLPEDIYVDREMWEKIVLNLVSNAFKFTLEGGIEVSVGEAGAHRVALRVRDTGVGIPANELPHVFDRFHRVRGTQGRTHEGTGIGLALVQELARLHGGTVEVESEHGRGTTFTVLVPKGRAHLPAERVRGARTLQSTALGASSYVEEALRWLPGEDAPPARRSHADDLASDAPRVRRPTDGARVLLADDNADMRDYVRRLLAHSYEVEAVGDGRAALEAARGRAPDLVLSDVMMPRLDGFGLLRELRADERTKSVPVILLSARAGEEARIEGLEAGADDYLVKPFSARELLARVQAHLELARVRREAGEQLRESEARFRDMADNAPVMVWVTEPDGVCTYLSRSWYEFTGQTPETGLGFGWVDATHPDDRQRTHDAFVSANEGRGEFRVEYRLRRRDGQYRWAIDSAKPRFGAGGEFLGYVGSVIDITERKRAEMLLETQRQSLEMVVGGAPLGEVLDFLTRAVERQSEGRAVASVLLLDEGGRLRNGASPSLPDEYLRAIDGLAPDPEVGTCAAAAATGEVVLTPDIDSDAKWAALKRLPLDLGLQSAWSQPIVARDGRVLGTFGTYFRESREPSDFERQAAEMLARTAALAIERARAEEERERLLGREQAARREAEEASRLKDEFLATVSHELRTPLTAILGWAHMLRAGQFAGDSAANAFEVIERNARSQAQLIDDLLDVSRIITGKLRLDVRPVAPDACIEAAIEAVRPAAEAKGVRLQKVLDTGLVTVSGDPVRLQQILWNLLSNAIKFTPKGGRVQVRLERVDSHVEIAVSDTGPGIAPDFLPHVFDRFRQADMGTTRRHGGLGLGLAIVRHLVELHGGTVRAESAGEGHGATFTVLLPVAPINAPAPSEPRVHPAARETLPTFECPDRLDGLRVLVVDDEPDAREMLRAGLGRCGAEVTTAASAAEALSEIRKSPPDLLISDIGMPDVDGYALIRQVRGLPAGQGGRVPAVALTAYARTEDRMQALRAGYQMHVTKPVELTELAAVVASLAKRDGSGGTFADAGREGLNPAQGGFAD